MLTSPRNPDWALVETTDLEGGAILPPAIARYETEIRRIVAWAREYLCAPHSELGRDGPVCPYAQTSLNKRLFYVAVHPGSDLEPGDVEERLMGLRDWFLELEPRTGASSIFKTILCLFPDISMDRLSDLIDGVQERLRPEYVERGLMVGEFHPRPPEKAGLWNPDFRPLQSPVPLLAIRHMVATDFAFLKDEKDLVEAYLACFRDRVPAHLRLLVQEATERFGIRLDRNQLSPHVHPRVAAVLQRDSLACAVHRHADLPGRIRSPRDFADVLGYPLQRVTKSLFLKTGPADDTIRYAVVVCSVTTQVDFEGVAAHLGARRVEMASLEELEAQLAFSPGGVSPLGVPEGIPVLLDEGLFEWPTVTVAAGEVAVEVEIEPEALRRSSGGEVVAVARVAEGRPV